MCLVFLKPRGLDLLYSLPSRGGSRIFEKGGHEGPRRGSNFGPNVKKPTSWTKMDGPDPLDPPPPDPPVPPNSVLFMRHINWFIIKKINVLKRINVLRDETILSIKTIM